MVELKEVVRAGSSRALTGVPLLLLLPPELLPIFLSINGVEFYGRLFVCLCINVTESKLHMPLATEICIALQTHIDGPLEKLIFVILLPCSQLTLSQLLGFILFNLL